LKDLLEGSSYFYAGESARERKELDLARIADSVPGIGEDLDGGSLVRIGRHSGAESVTVEGQRQISIKQGPKKNVTLDHATTFWLAAETRAPKLKSHLLPFGWVALSAVEDGLEDLFREEESSWKEKLEEEKESRRLLIQRAAEEKRKVVEAARKKAEEEERRRAEEERKKAELEAMSPEERDIASLFEPSVTEEQTVRIFMKLDQFSDANRKIAATVLKECWMRAGKWVKKDCSKKQWVKVQKIKSILGES